jgi:flagellar biosynthesis protein FlhB
VARSQELNSVIIISFGFLTIYFLGPILFSNLGTLMKHNLSEATTIILTPARMQLLFTEEMGAYAIVVGPILLALAVFACLINFAQVGFMFSAKALTPKFDAFDLSKGLKKIFSRRVIVELIRDSIKTVIIGYVAYETIVGWEPEIISLGDKGVGEFARVLGRLSLLLAIKISAVLFILALFDFAYQKFEFLSNVKMTRQEVKEEFKDTEGNPVLKSRIRQVQRDMARQRMMSEIPKADVVITNPTHIAVALKYNPSEMPAPMVVAKGQRLIAERIKEIAREHKIPVVENKPLARSLFKLVDAGSYIPGTLYRAVAEVLAYIYQLKNKGGMSRG